MLTENDKFRQMWLQHRTSLNKVILTDQEYEVIQALDLEGPLTMGEIIKRLGIFRPRGTILLQSLVKKQYIDRNQIECIHTRGRPAIWCYTLREFEE